MPNNPLELVSPTSLALLTPVLKALDAEDRAILKPVGSLPAPCYRIARINAVVGATSIHSIAMFRAEMVTLAAAEHVDVALLRHGPHPETLDEVSFDIVIGRDRSMRMLWELAAYRHADGSYWLVPPIDGAGPSIVLGSYGFGLVIDPPYQDLDQRGDGISRAARETVLAMRRLRRS